MKNLNKPTAAVLIAALILIWAAVMFGPKLGMTPAMHEGLVATVGSIGVALAAMLPKLFGKDADGDGIPDILDGDEK